MTFLNFLMPLSVSEFAGVKNIYLNIFFLMHKFPCSANQLGGGGKALAECLAKNAFLFFILLTCSLIQFASNQVNVLQYINTLNIHTIQAGFLAVYRYCRPVQR